MEWLSYNDDDMADIQDILDLCIKCNYKPMPYYSNDEENKKYCLVCCDDIFIFDLYSDMITMWNKLQRGIIKCEEMVCL